MSSGDRRIGAVVLAAGASTRLGQPKQLLQWGDKSLLRHTVEVALSAGLESVVVVLGAQAEQFQKELVELPASIIINPDWEEGMASSLRAGIGTLTSADTPVDAILILLCDQPLITPALLRSLVGAYRAGGKPAVISIYDNGQPGPPCLFAASLFPDLLALTGKQGAKQLFSRLPESELERVLFLQGSHDIDTLDDWKRLVEMTEEPEYSL